MMKFGLLTAILDGWTFEEVVDIASDMGFKCLEVACWPAGKAERRYAGVSHIDCERICEDDEYTAYVKNLVASKGIEISSLAFYPNVLDANKEKADAAIEHLKAVIKASGKLGVGMVTTYIGKAQYKTFEETIELFKAVWPGLIALAEECGVLAYPLDYMSPKIPGLGDVNWGAFVSALNDIRFNGCAVIEVEDKAFEGSREDILNSIRLSKRYLDNFII